MTMNIYKLAVSTTELLMVFLPPWKKISGPKLSSFIFLLTVLLHVFNREDIKGEIKEEKEELAKKSDCLDQGIWKS